MKKIEISIVGGVITLGVIGIITLGVIGAISDKGGSCAQCATTVLEELPKPEVSGGARGELGIDKNINESTIDRYLGRSDAVYRDMRMLIDEADYEAIGGDSYLSGYVDGFEVVPYPMLVNVEGLPAAVGETYHGPTLFTQKDGKYTANYEESMEILEYYFPKDKTIFLMCGGGGYAGMTKAMLVSLGWDADKIYNVGAYWSYDGEHNVQVKRTEQGKTVYDFWKVPYHEIDFSLLTAPQKVTGLTTITAEEFVELVQAKKSFVLVAHMITCPAELPLTTIAKELAVRDNLKIYELTEEEFKKTELAKEIKYLPTAVVFRQGVMVKYLDAEKDEDVQYYKDIDRLREWLKI